MSEVNHDLSKLLAPYEEGTWVVLDHAMTKVLGASMAFDEALQQAGVSAGKGGLIVRRGRRPVMLQVPGPGPYF